MRNLFQQLSGILSVVAFVAHALVADELIPEDTCIVEIQAPPGATVTLDGEVHSTTRKFTYESLERGKLYPVSMTVQVGTEDAISSTLLLRGGWHVPVVFPPTGTPQLALQNGHSWQVGDVSISSDERFILTCAQEAILWDAVTGVRLRTYRGHKGTVFCAKLSADGHRVVTGSSDQTAILLDTVSGAKLRTFSGHESGVSDVALSVDGRRLFTSADDAIAIVWDVVTGAKLRTFKAPTRHAGDVRIWSVRISADGNRVLTKLSNDTAILWDTSTGRMIHQFGELTERQSFSDREGLTCAALSSDGRRVLVGYSDGNAVLWDSVSKTRIHTFPGPDYDGRVDEVTFSTDGKRVATCFRYTRKKGKTHWQNSGATIWDTVTGRKIQTISLPEHSGFLSAPSFRNVSLSTDGRKLLTG